VYSFSVGVTALAETLARDVRIVAGGFCYQFGAQIFSPAAPCSRMRLG
jgi:hypothetical protein